MEPLENFKDALGVLGFNANTVVLNRECPFFALLFGRDVDEGCCLPTIFERVANQVLKQLSDLGSIGKDGR